MINRTFDARPDSIDFRDRPYVPSLVEVPPTRPLNAYRALAGPVLDQGTDGACTGFGLAAVAHYLLRSRRTEPNVTGVSTRMLYEMAKRYDEWEGTDYSGSSARGAIKGWHKHGVCSDDSWPYDPGTPGHLTPERIADAATRPLGAYFRVNHRDLVAVHTAITEVGAIYATGVVHAGWEKVDPKTGMIPSRTGDTDLLGGHAFAVVAYDERGLWIQNSWGDDWGFEGFGLLTYEDWLTTATDAWVLRLGAPVTIGTTSESLQTFTTERQPHSYSFHEMRPHIVGLGNDGRLATAGTYATDPADLRDIARAFKDRVEREQWKNPRIVLYAHGGLVGASSAVAQAARMRPTFLNSEIYPIFFVWNSDWYSTLGNMIEDSYLRWVREAPAGGPVEFLTDRIDDLIERIARFTTVAKAGWSEIKENASRASTLVSGGGRAIVDVLAETRREQPFELHLVGHSAGSILHAELADYIGRTDLGLAIDSAALWAPACTMEVFNSTYARLLDSSKLGSLSLFVLRDEAERDDSAGPYRKSILYLVSNALEDKARIPFFSPDGEPLLGMEKFLHTDDAINDLRRRDLIDVVLCPTRQTANTPTKNRSKASTHIGFDSDEDTLRATIARIVGRPAQVAPGLLGEAAAGFERSQSMVS